MLSIILAAIAGAAILFFILTTLIYRGQVKNAESERDEAIKLASQAMDAKQSAEDGFTKAKQFFDDKMKMPVAAIMTDEQIDNIAKYLAGKLLLSDYRQIPPTAVKN